MVALTVPAWCGVLTSSGTHVGLFPDAHSANSALAAWHKAAADDSTNAAKAGIPLVAIVGCHSTSAHPASLFDVARHVVVACVWWIMGVDVALLLRFLCRCRVLLSQLPPCA